MHFKFSILVLAFLCFINSSLYADLTAHWKFDEPIGDVNLLIEEISDDINTLIQDRAEGNPFYVEEIIRSLIDSDLLIHHKPSDSWNIEEGMKLRGPQIGSAERKRTELYHRVKKFMETYEFLILPVSQVPPFDVKQRYVTEINRAKMETYIDWMKSCYYITTVGLPAISVPCGFTVDDLPVGVQIVGRHQDDLGR